MAMDLKAFLQQLDHSYESFTPSYKKIASYIMLNYKYIPMLSLESMSHNIGISDATIVRFCQHIGYHGYTDMKNMLSNMINADDYNDVDRLTKTIQEIGKENKDYAQIFNQELINLKDAISNIDTKSIHHAATIMDHSEKVYVMGLGSSTIIANFIYYHLDRLNVNCKLIQYGGLGLFETISNISSKDVLLIASYPRYSKDSLKALKVARENGAQTILITDKLSNCLTDYAHCTIAAPSENNIYFYNSYISSILTCNVLILEFSSLNKDRNTLLLDRMKKDTEYYL
jgi:DNA-binding MurR/RpiR family transcriptional regulator